MYSLFVSSVVATSAQAANFSCVLQSDRSVTLAGTIGPDDLNLKISDKKNILELNESQGSIELNASRLQRKTENKYKFSAYYGEISAFEDLSVSVPKELKSNRFVAYLTVYKDSGDNMVPEASKALSCLLK